MTIKAAAEALFRRDGFVPIAEASAWTRNLFSRPGSPDLVRLYTCGGQECVSQVSRVTDYEATARLVADAL